ALAFAPDGRTLYASASSGKPVRVWDLSVAPPKERDPVPATGATIESLAFTRDGKRFFTAEGCVVRAWDVTGSGCRERHPPRGHTASVTSLAFSGDDRTLFSADGGATLRVWALANATWQERHVIPDVATTILLTPDGRDLIGTGIPGSWSAFAL